MEFNADYTGWNRLDTVTIHQASGSSVPLVLGWESRWYYEWGVTRVLGQGWSVSAGYVYNENSVPDAHYSPLVADLDRHFLSVGMGHQGRHFDFDVAYQFGIAPERTVRGSARLLAGQTADGRYGYTSQAVFITAGWRY